MADRTLYEDDLYAWSKQQADALRDAARRDSSNRVDWDHVIEEIEDVGGNKLSAVESALRLIFVHLIKIVSDPKSRALRKWRGEIVNFHADVLQEFLPSMRQNIDLQRVWKRALDQAAGQLEVQGKSLRRGLPEQCPFALDALIVSRIDVAALETAVADRAG